MKMSKNVLITGITGQDGAYMAKYLLSKGYMFLVLIEDYRPQTFGGYKHLMFLIRFI